MRRTRYIAPIASCALAALFAIAPAAAAHGIQGRADLPVPIRAFYWAAAIVLVASFVGLAFGWRCPLLAGVLQRRSRPVVLGPVARGTLAAARAVSVAVLLLVLATALLGSTDLNDNFAPIWVFVVWWIGIALVAATLGDWWRAVHPIAVFGRLLAMPERTDRLPARVGIWPAFALLLVFTWLELVYPTAADVRLLGYLLLAWSVGTLLAMRRYGIEPTLDRIEPFSAYTGVLGGLGIWGRATDGSLERRPPILGVLRQSPLPGLAAFIGLLIGSVSYDGLSRTLWWKQQVSGGVLELIDRGVSAKDAQLVYGTFALAVMVLLAISAFVAFARLAERMGGLPRRSRFGTGALAFAPSLIPIAAAYVVAHYFSYVWFQSQSIIRLASDPFGRGWDLLGTVDHQVDYSTLSAEAVWIVQVASIVVGHVLALVLAHDRALELEAESGVGAALAPAPAPAPGLGPGLGPAPALEPGSGPAPEPGPGPAPGSGAGVGRVHAVRSQWPMLALMVLYTIGGLYFLSEGLNS